MQEVGGVLDGILAVAHPEQYAAAREVFQQLYRGPDDSQHRKIADEWPSVLHAVHIISNRETIYHRDTNGRPEWYDLLSTVGSYGEQAVLSMRTLGVSVPYDSGSVVLLCSRLVMHGVPEVAPDRVCYAWLMREDVVSALGIQAPGWAQGGMGAAKDAS